MASKIDERDDFGGFRTDLDPVERSMFRLVDHVPLAVEAEDVVTN